MLAVSIFLFGFCVLVCVGWYAAAVGSLVDCNVAPGSSTSGFAREVRAGNSGFRGASLRWWSPVFFECMHGGPLARSEGAGVRICALHRHFRNGALGHYQGTAAPWSGADRSPTPNGLAPRSSGHS